MRAQYNALSRSDWREAIHFGNDLAESRGSPRHRGAALSNLCYAYAANGDLAEAAEACNAAVELAPDAWRAVNNRGAARWLAGDHAAASLDFTAAAALAGNEDEVRANLALAQCN